MVENIEFRLHLERIPYYSFNNFIKNLLCVSHLITEDIIIHKMNKISIFMELTLSKGTILMAVNKDIMWYNLYFRNINYMVIIRRNESTLGLNFSSGMLLQWLKNDRERFMIRLESMWIERFDKDCKEKNHKN